MAKRVKNKTMGKNIKKKGAKIEEAAFAMGCFWGPELLFSKAKGVVKTEVGFMGGKVESPSYLRVCTGTTGHAETVHVFFDTKKISYGSLLELFWKNHNPTQGSRQGLDIGTQYRSMIFYYDDEQKKKAFASLKQAQKKWDKEITTEIKEAGPFYKAEEHHQKYLEKRGRNTC